MTPPLLSLAPFLLTLIGIATLPLVAHHWWERNRNRAIFAGGIAVPTAVWWVLTYGSGSLLHVGQEYAEFIAIMAALYIASGGIYLRGSLRGRPAVNVAICAVGSVLANLIGTTGASMVLLRPFLRANAERAMRARILCVVFFTFTVSNIGGCLTPLGDPPLFLGFLRGVPFTWTLSLAGPWAMALLVLFVAFYLLDRRHAAAPPVVDVEKPGLSGARNLLLLLTVAAVVLGQGVFRWPFGVQVGAMMAIAAVSMVVTPVEIRRRNRFTFGPILEVAILFAGIFVTMVPALEILRARSGELGLTQPWHYFWATGLLSSFLDNAPTYLVLGTMAATQTGVATIGDLAGAAPHLLAAVSLGAVFMGANTYIGNGPNFMVKAIAEENGVRMPGFFGYMKYSAVLLLPLFVLLTWFYVGR